MKNKQRTTNNEQRAYRAFTLIEMVVAIALLSMVLGFSSVIFKTSIEAYRTAGANTEIMQKLRAITDQLNSDFKGLQKDAPLLIWFYQDTGVSEPNRYDQIMFFANGDFQSTGLYNGRTLVGNVARIFYGQAVVNRDITVNFVPPWWEENEEKRILGRRQHILTADLTLIDFPNITDPVTFTSSFISQNNDAYEYDKISLAQWQMISNDSAYNNQVIDTCFYGRPGIDLEGLIAWPTLHMLMSEGVGSFQIQWAYWYVSGTNVECRWWPNSDPDGDPVTADSDFSAMNASQFGIYFNTPGGVNPALYWYGPEGAKIQTGWTFAGFYPKALKFTFTLYDSKGIIRNGRTFTHIVYLE